MSRVDLSDYGYVNARVRGMRSHLLTRDFFMRMVEAQDFEALHSLFEQTIYRREINEAFLLDPERPDYDRALSLNLIASFRKIHDAIGGEGRQLVSVLFSKYDLQNVKTVLRGKRSNALPGEITKLLVPVGSLRMEVLEKMADARAPTGTPDAHSLVSAQVRVPAAPPPARAAQPLPAAVVRVTASSFDAPMDQASFEPGNVADGDPTTAWVEGGGEGGPGEWLRIAFDTPQHVADIQCVNGVGAPALFQHYSRIQDLDVELSTGRRVRVHLRDANGWQPMLRVDETVSWMVLHLVSVYPGERSPRAALSEVEITVGDPPR